jgi:hypothetical protein
MSCGGGWCPGGVVGDGLVGPGCGSPLLGCSRGEARCARGANRPGLVCLDSGLVGAGRVPRPPPRGRGRRSAPRVAGHPGVRLGERPRDRTGRSRRRVGTVTVSCWWAASPGRSIAPLAGWLCPGVRRGSSTRGAAPCPSSCQDAGCPAGTVRFPAAVCQPGRAPVVCGVGERRPGQPRPAAMGSSGPAARELVGGGRRVRPRHRVFAAAGWRPAARRGRGVAPSRPHGPPDGGPGPPAPGSQGRWGRHPASRPDAGPRTRPGDGRSRRTGSRRRGRPGRRGGQRSPPGWSGRPPAAGAGAPPRVGGSRVAATRSRAARPPSPPSGSGSWAAGVASSPGPGWWWLRRSWSGWPSWS